MRAIAIFLGLRARPVCEPCLAEERERKRAHLRRLLSEIAQPVGG